MGPYERVALACILAPPLWAMSVLGAFWLGLYWSGLLEKYQSLYRALQAYLEEWFIMPANQKTFITTFTAESPEWYTPAWLVRQCRRVLGVIDLDPASSPEANSVVRAQEIYTMVENGLDPDRPWYGRVFLNPPSAKHEVNPLAKPKLWAERLTAEYRAGNVTEALLVIYSAMGYKWYQALYRDFWVCHLEDLPEFWRPGGETVGKAKKGVSVVYMGDNWLQFARAFVYYGRIIPPEETLKGWLQAARAAEAHMEAIAHDLATA